MAVGCGLLALLFSVCLFAALAAASTIDRQAARYPGAVQISRHSNYSGLPASYRWDDSYLAPDNFKAVYNWYSLTYDLGAEARANDRCIHLEGSHEQFLSQRHVSVFICDTDEGPMAFVSRSTTLPFATNGQSQVRAGVRALQALFPIFPEAD